jgi:hypothetical protein
MKNLILCLLAIALLLVSCQKNEIVPAQESSTLKLNELKLESIDINIENNISLKSTGKNGSFESFVATLNQALLEHGIQLEKMELFGDGEAGSTIRFKDVGNKQLLADFVPNDPRNWWPREPYIGEWTDGTVGYWIDGTQQGTTSGMSEGETINAFQSAMNTWGSVNCSNGLVLSHQGVTSPDDYGDVGLVQFLTGFGGFPGVVYGSILHAGNLPAWWFEAVLGSTNVLGVTFTFVFGNPGAPSDIDQNGKRDVAFREIYINGSRNFQDAPDDVMFNDIADYETVVMHEVGHGLSQAHFGKSTEGKNGEIHFSPYALMNSGYSKAQREITATDNAGHCSIWDNWPNE